MNKSVKFVAKAIAFGLVAGSVFQGVEYAGSQFMGTQIEDSGSNVDADTSHPVASVQVGTGNAGNGTGDVSGIVEQVIPSLVSIDVTATVQTNTFFGPQVSESTGSGSGIIISEKDDTLFIATNNHVVEGADTVKVVFCDDTVMEAKVRGTDSVNDLAVVEVDASKLTEETRNAIRVAAIGDSSQTKVGEQAIAIGNALGCGTSVTVGYISARDREIESGEGNGVKLFQTDAAINPGNSGGALVNSRGEVIGINSSKFASEEIEGMGFAIPMETAEPILTSLMEYESGQPEQTEEERGIGFGDFRI